MYYKTRPFDQEAATLFEIEAETARIKAEIDAELRKDEELRRLRENLLNELES